mmetsp:Transcript_9038/g.13210  ORF Transcript_9038/g.13210 Transcript_9038/m.13210 type:complete len:104 (+) Transcript_9038:44-355(+)
MEEIKSLGSNFSRRVSGGLPADLACQQVIDNLKLCRQNKVGDKSACSSQELAVLECRGSFFCPAVQVQWMKCVQAKAEGRNVVCDDQKKSLEECVAYYGQSSK